METTPGTWEYVGGAVFAAAAPDMIDLIRAAVARVELANREGNTILSAWLADAHALISRLEGE